LRKFRLWTLSLIFYVYILTCNWCKWRVTVLVGVWLSLAWRHYLCSWTLFLLGINEWRICLFCFQQL